MDTSSLLPTVTGECLNTVMEDERCTMDGSFDVSFRLGHARHHGPEGPGGDSLGAHLLYSAQRFWHLVNTRMSPDVRGISTTGTTMAVNSRRAVTSEKGSESLLCSLLVEWMMAVFLPRGLRRFVFQIERTIDDGFDSLAVYLCCWASHPRRKRIDECNRAALPGNPMMHKVCVEKKMIKVGGRGGRALMQVPGS